MKNNKADDKVRDHFRKIARFVRDFIRFLSGK